MKLRAKHLSAGLAFLLSSTMLSGMAYAQDADTGAEAVEDAIEITVVGKGQTRSVSTLVPANLDVLPPGTSVQKALNFLPGVSYPCPLARRPLPLVSKHSHVRRSRTVLPFAACAEFLNQLKVGPIIEVVGAGPKVDYPQQHNAFEAPRAVITKIKSRNRN